MTFPDVGAVLTDPIILLLAIVTFLAGISQGATGLGFAQITATAMSLLIEPKAAIVILAITVGPIAGVQAIHLRRERLSTERISRVIVGTLVGVPIGISLLNVLPTRAIAALLGGFTLLYVLSAVLRMELWLSPSQERVIGPAAGVAAGVANGSIGHSGPILIVYSMALKLPPRTFAQTISVLFAVMGIFRLGGFVVAGNIDPRTLVVGLLMLVPAVIGQRLGFTANRFLSRRVFEVIVLISLAFGSVALLGRAICG